MSQSKDFDPIASSLRRQFSPPSLAALERRIEAEAARLEDAQPQALYALPPVHTEPSSTWPLVLTVALAVAAAVLLMLIRAWEPDVGQSAPPPVAETREVAEVIPPTSSQRAGLQLDGFLGRGDTLAGEAQRTTTEPPEVCNGEREFPQLVPGPTVELLGECGGLTGVACADFDLPADRLLLVRLDPEGRRAIVCIERPWTDPHPKLPPGSDYNIFRRELGDHILYEVTPLDEPRALELIRL